MKPTMHDGTPVDRPPRRARPPAMLMAAAVLTTAALALLTAACSSVSSAIAGSPHAAPTSSSPAAAPASSSSAATAGISSPAAGSSATAQSAVAYSQCMRASGVPSYPDPDSGGHLPKGDAGTFGVSDSTYQAAQSTCQHLLPTGGSFDEQANECILNGDCPPALVQQMLTADRKFAECMRAHGVPSWPDPIIGANGGPIFKVSGTGITFAQLHSPPISTTSTMCLRVDPAPVAMA